MGVSSTSLAKYIYSARNTERLNRDKELYLIYNGQVRETIRAAILKEFKKPETIKELLKRIIPINIMQKVVNKLGAVYKNPPARKPVDDAETDMETVDSLVTVMDINTKMKLLNRFVKLSKCAALEPYVSDDGKPSLRTLPSHTFTQYSESSIDPETPTHTIKHLSMGGDRVDHRHVVWSKERHFLMDGYGKIIEEYPQPYGVIPIVYVKEGIELMPVQDDDLYFLQIAICLLLTDLAFAAKYQSWSVIAIIGAQAENLTFNPNSVVTIPASKDGTQSDIKTIQPKVDTAAVLTMVEALVGLLLTTKNLSVGNVSLKLANGMDAASGVAKVLDQAETTEDKQDQRAMFLAAEKDLFTVLKVMLPVWKESGALATEYLDLTLSDAFIPLIEFSDPKPQTSEKEVVEVETLKLEAGLTLLEMSLRRLYPEKTQQEILDLKKQIIEEMATIKEILGTNKPVPQPPLPQLPGQGQGNGQPQGSNNNQGNTQGNGKPTQMPMTTKQMEQGVMGGQGQ
jgi:hypothetical protein